MSGKETWKEVIALFERHGMAPLPGRLRDELVGLVLDERNEARAEIEKAWAEAAMLRRMICDMRGHTFFCQDADGVLRRWYPPSPVAALAAGEGEA